MLRDFPVSAPTKEQDECRLLYFLLQEAYTVISCKMMWRYKQSALLSPDKQFSVIVSQVTRMIPEFQWCLSTL